LDENARSTECSCALGHGVDEGLADAVILPSRREADQPDGAAEQRHDANHGEDAKQTQQERLGTIGLHEHQPDRQADQQEREDDQPSDAGDALGPVDDRLGMHGGRGAIRHEGRFATSGRTRESL
jgi:hypothetical protein